MEELRQKRPRIVLGPDEYDRLRLRVLKRDGWKCQSCGTGINLQVHHLAYRSQLGPDASDNLITVCVKCHRRAHKQA
jgi:5-methylcytosine-specific restriction endonuclease McrA